MKWGGNGIISSALKRAKSDVLLHEQNRCLMAKLNVVGVRRMNEV